MVREECKAITEARVRLITCRKIRWSTREASIRTASSFVRPKCSWPKGEIAGGHCLVNLGGGAPGAMPSTVR